MTVLIILLAWIRLSWTTHVVSFTIMPIKKLRTARCCNSTVVVGDANDAGKSGWKDKLSDY